MDKNVMHIAFCTDDTYMMPVGVAIVSICENNKAEDILFHLVITSNETIEKTKEKIAPLTNIIDRYQKEYRIYRLEEKDLASFECPGGDYISTTAFARIFLPQLLPDSIKKVLYLDGDIAVDGNLRELWETELKEDCPMGAIIDSCGTSVAYRASVQIPLSIPYVNSGILLMNLDCWRKEHLIDQMVQCASEHSFSFLDQDVLNYVLRDRIKILPVKYNVQLLFLLEQENRWMVEYQYLEEIRDAIEHPVIVHYLSANKPWKEENCPKREIWHRYQQLSPWNAIPLEPLNCRFERSSIYAGFIDAYWSDASLMKESLPSFLALFNAAVKLKNKKLFMQVASQMMRGMTRILEFVYRRKVKGILPK